MRKVVIFGNSGSGKSTLAKYYQENYGLSHLDFDTLAWEDITPPKRKPIDISQQQIKGFTYENKHWDWRQHKNRQLPPIRLSL